MMDNFDAQVNNIFQRGGSRTKAMTELKTTPVILVCIYNKNGTLITHDLLHAVFSTYGNILRILIFEKMKVWKAFIEYDNISSAIEAKRNLDDFLLFSDGSRINIYFSNLEVIKFQNNNSGGIDYTALDTPKLSDINQPSSRVNLNHSYNSEKQLGLSSKVNELDSEDDEEDKNEPIIPPPSQFKRQARPRRTIDPNDEFKDDDILDMINRESNQKEILFRPNEEEASPDNEDHEKEKEGFSAFANPNFFNYRPQEPEVVETTKSTFDNQFLWQQSQPPGLIFNMPEQNTFKMEPIQHTYEQPMFIKPSNSFGNKNTLQSLQNANRNNFSPNNNNMNTGSHHGQISAYSQPFTPLSSQQIQNNSISNFIPKYSNSPEPTSVDNYYGNDNPQQNLIDMIEQDILTKILQKFQSPENDFSNQQNQNFYQDLENNLRTINNINPGFTNEMNIDINDLSQMNRNTLYQLYNNLTMLLGKDAENLDSNKKSQVLYVKGLESKEIRVSMLYNIFSNFGNILKIIFIRSKAVALLEFENAESSTVSKDYLNNIVFMGKPLRIYYSNYSIINLRNKKPSKESGEEIFIGNSKNFRFKKSKNISINPPSAILHISNLVKEVCQEKFIGSFFSPYGRIEGIKFLFMDGGKNMCLLKMSSIEESLTAMAYLHDTDLGGRKIQISFTRSKI